METQYFSRVGTFWVRGAAALLFVLLAAGAVPWCCVIPSSHHGQLAAAAPGHGHQAHGVASHGAAHETDDRGAGYTSAATLCGTGGGAAQLRGRPAVILSWVHLGWVFHPQLPSSPLIDDMVTDAEAVVAWRAPPSLRSGPDTPPPRRV